MKVVYEYSHLGGTEILHMRYPKIEEQINDVIASIKDVPMMVSKEKTKKGQLVYAPGPLNKLFKKGFEGHGFREKRTPYNVSLPNYPLTIEGAFKQVDFVKEEVLVEVQLGKYAFMFYDMAKFQYFFNDEGAEVGVEIVPCHNFHKGMSTGTSYGEQLVGDILRLRRHFPAVPVKIILIDVDSAKLPSTPTVVDEPEELTLLGSELSDVDAEEAEAKLQADSAETEN